MKYPRRKYFILGVNGSPNKDGRTSKMLDRVLAEIKKLGARTKKIDLCDYKIFPHNGKLNPEKYIEDTDDDMPELQKLVLKADGIIFATPTHWLNMSSLMKLFTDRLTSLEDYDFLMEGKVAGFITYGPQGGATNAAMTLTMVANHMGMAIPPYAAIFDEGRNDGWIDKEYAVLAKNMLNQIRAWRELKLNWGYPDAKYEMSPIEFLGKEKRMTTKKQKYRKKK